MNETKQKAELLASYIPKAKVINYDNSFAVLLDKENYLNHLLSFSANFGMSCMFGYISSQDYQCLMDMLEIVEHKIIKEGVILLCPGLF